MRAPVFQNMYSRAGENTLFIIEYAKNIGITGGHPHKYIYIYIYIHIHIHTLLVLLVSLVSLLLVLLV